MLQKKVKCKKNPDISQFYYEPQALSESEAYTSILPIRYPLQPPPPIYTLLPLMWYTLFSLLLPSSSLCIPYSTIYIYKPI